MDDNIIEIRDDEINVEEIMKKIQENIQHRKTAGELLPDPDMLISTSTYVNTFSEDNNGSREDLAYINSNWDIHNNRYLISSHHPYIGKFFIKGRQLVHGEVRRYIDPVISWQTEFNGSTVRIINRTLQKYAELDQRQHELKTAFSSLKQEQDKTIDESISMIKNELDSKFEAKVQKQLLIIKENRNETNQAILHSISDLKNEFDIKFNNMVFTSQSELEHLIVENLNNQIHPDELNLEMLIEKGRIKVKENVDARVKEIFAQMEEDIHARAWLAHVLEDRVQKGLAQKRDPHTMIFKENLNYFLFEEQFRGSRDVIKQRQLAFLSYFENCSRVLDIGCGRGEFLEILKSHDIGGIGVDCDPDMVVYCRSLQLVAEQSDAITYLMTLEDNSLDGIFIDQVVEHLDPEYLIRLLALCHQKIKIGYYIVVETINPLSFVSFVNFYIDLTHKKPVHPETLLYLFTASGFRECETQFFSPVSDECRLKKIGSTANMNEIEKENVKVYNHNIGMLNSLLFGAQDYAVIGKK